MSAGVGQDGDTCIQIIGPAGIVPAKPAARPWREAMGIRNLVTQVVIIDRIKFWQSVDREYCLEQTAQLDKRITGHHLPGCLMLEPSDSRLRDNFRNHNGTKANDW